MLHGSGGSRISVSDAEHSVDCMLSWPCSWSKMASSLLRLMGFSTKRSIPHSSQGLSAHDITWGIRE